LEERMKELLKRAAVAGLSTGGVAGAALWYSVVSRGPVASPAVPIIASVFVGGVVAAVVAGLVVLVGRYPANARSAAIFATGACVVLSALLAWGAREGGDHAEWSVFAFAWALAWPFAFVVSLWVDVKRTIARKILDGVKSKSRAA
jgi:hypothetical protein